MNLLAGKNALIFGVANNRSIAWGVAEAFKAQGANVGISYAGEALQSRAEKLGNSIGLDFIEPCDLSSDEEIAAIAQKTKAHFGQIDILVHAVAFAERDDLEGAYYQTSRSGFHTAMDISVFSLSALVQAFEEILADGASVLTFTYYGAEKVITNYNVMGVAKAALEASVRYLAVDLGGRGIRVNAISAGPVRTLSAASISGFRSMYTLSTQATPIAENIDKEDVANAAVFLASELSGKITGEVLHVDSGYNIIGIPAIPTGDNET